MYGIDVSHHQRASQVPWAEIRETSDFCICRVGYGGGLRDREVERHMRAAREHGYRVGLYQFFRPTQTPDAHFALFQAVAETVGCEPGDIIPWLDIEADPLPKPGVAVSAAWSEPALELVQRIEERFGGCGIYITQREWGHLGRPSWVLERPMWIAHYTQSRAATPDDRPAHIHQHRVGPYDPQGPGGYFASKTQLVLDQNRALRPLPLIAGAVAAGPGKPEWSG